MNIVLEYRMWIIAGLVVIMAIKPATSLFQKGWSLLKKVKPSVQKLAVKDDSDKVEITDFEALRYLRKRASDMGDAELVSLIKEISGRLYDHYV